MFGQLDAVRMLKQRGRMVGKLVKLGKSNKATAIALGIDTS